MIYNIKFSPSKNNFISNFVEDDSHVYVNIFYSKEEQEFLSIPS